MNSKGEAGCCPVCGCGDLEYGDCDQDSDCIMYSYTCSACLTEGTEYHDVSFSEHNVDDMHPNPVGPDI